MGRGRPRLPRPTSAYAVGADAGSPETAAQRLARNEGHADHEEMVLGPTRARGSRGGLPLRAAHPTNVTLIIASACGYFYLSGVETFAVEFAKSAVPGQPGAGQRAAAGPRRRGGGRCAGGRAAVGSPPAPAVPQRPDHGHRGGRPGRRRPVHPRPGDPRDSPPALVWLVLRHLRALRPEPADRRRPPRHRAVVAVGPRRGRAHRAAHRRPRPWRRCYSGVVSDHVFGGGRSGLQWTFLVMLLPLAANGVLLVRALRTYPHDVATAAASQAPASAVPSGSEPVTGEASRGIPWFSPEPDPSGAQR